MQPTRGPLEIIWVQEFRRIGHDERMNRSILDPLFVAFSDDSLSRSDLIGLPQKQPMQWSTKQLMKFIRM